MGEGRQGDRRLCQLSRRATVLLHVDRPQQLEPSVDAEVDHAGADSTQPASNSRQRCRHTFPDVSTVVEQLPSGYRACRGCESQADSRGRPSSCGRVGIFFSMLSRSSADRSVKRTIGVSSRCWRRVTLVNGITPDPDSAASAAICRKDTCGPGAPCRHRVIDRLGTGQFHLHEWPANH